MDCKKAGSLLMKYMDGDITKREALKLREHTECCDKCREEFLAYYEILEGVDEAPSFEAPINFEDSVMTQIKGIEPQYMPSFGDNMKCIVASIVSVLFGMAGWMYVNRINIRIAFEEASQTFPTSHYFYGAEMFVINFKYKIDGILDAVENVLTGYVPQFQIVAFIIVMWLIFTASYTREKRVDC